MTSISPAERAETRAQTQALRVCTRCVMDTSDPEITFDRGGVCNHCHEYDRMVRATVVSGERGREQLDEFVATIKRDGARKRYDCVIGMSGGVDSTFVAYMVTQLGLRPLAVHLDNGWDSEIAVGNIALAVEKLGIDLHTHVVDWEEFKDIQLAFLRAGVPDCEIPSDHAIVASVHQTASRLGVRHTIWGYNTRTESHLPQAWSQGHYDWGYIKAVHRRYGSGRTRTFPHFRFVDYVTGYGRTQTRLNLLDYIDYSKKDALKLLERELGWRSYGDKHHESVYTRWYQGWFLPTRFGYDKRKTHLSSLICSGELTRPDALRELERPTYSPELQQADTEYVMKKFGLSREEFDAIMNTPRHSFHEFPSHWKLRNSAAFRSAIRSYQFVKYHVLRRQRALT